MSKLAHFRLEGDGVRLKSLVINEQEVGAQVRSVQFMGASNEVPRIIVESYVDDFELEGDGVVYVTRSTDFAEFLARLDVQALEAEVLRRQEWGSSSVGTTVDLLKEWFGGADST